MAVCRALNRRSVAGQDLNQAAAYGARAGFYDIYLKLPSLTVGFQISIWAALKRVFSTLYVRSERAVYFESTTLSGAKHHVDISQFTSNIGEQQPFDVSVTTAIKRNRRSIRIG